MKTLFIIDANRDWQDNGSRFWGQEGNSGSHARPPLVPKGGTMKKYFLPLLCGLFLLNGCGGGSMGGGSPVASLSTTTLTFPGDQIEGTASSSMPITLTNSGSATLTISSIAASANFQETNTCGSTLASGTSCTISVIFSPTTTGTLNGTVSIADTAPGSPQTVSLTGTATARTGSCSGQGQSCPPSPGSPCCAGLRCTLQAPLQFACE